MSRNIGNDRMDEDVALRVMRLEMQMEKVVTREHAMWGLLIVINAVTFVLVFGALLR
jgi:hypothetical protein